MSWARSGAGARVDFAAGDAFAAISLGGVQVCRLLSAGGGGRCRRRIRRRCS